MFGNNTQLVQEFGNALWKHLAQAYMDHCMAPKQTDPKETDSAMLEQHLQRFQVAEKFETDATTLL